MRKILVLVALTVSVGFLTGMYADTASAFSFNGLPFFGNSAKSCAAPVGCGYYCAPVSACKSVKAKGKAKAETVTKEKKVKTEKKQKKEKK
jgi:hypothetical protein